MQLKTRKLRPKRLDALRGPARNELTSIIQKAPDYWPLIDLVFFFVFFFFLLPPVLAFQHARPFLIFLALLMDNSTSMIY